MILSVAATTTIRLTFCKQFAFVRCLRNCSSHNFDAKRASSGAVVWPPTVVPGAEDHPSITKGKEEPPVFPDNKRPSPNRANVDAALLAKNGGLFGAYMQLSKCRLTALIACTAVSGFVMSPALASASLPLFGTCIAGTALLSASACTCNNVIERQHDSQMQRTKSRVLPVGRLTPLHALTFAAATGFAGLGLLCLGCNHLTSGLGFLNLALYAGCYTPLKRIHHSCTWVGAVVGAIPPLMGYAAATGHLDAASLVLAALLFSWQFPHFNALSWNLRRDYALAGYKMMCVTDEGLCRRTTLRHAVSLLLLCSLGAPYTELTTWLFSLSSLPLNAGMLFLAWKFYTKPEKSSASRLFRYTLIYLPALMALLYASKNSEPNISADKEDKKKGKEANTESSIPQTFDVLGIIKRLRT